MTLDDLLATLERHVPSVAAVGVILLSVLLGLLVRRLAFPPLARIAERTSWTGDDIFLASLRAPLPWWFFLAGLYVASLIVVLPATLAATFEKLLLSALILTGTLWVASLGVRLMERKALERAGAGGPTTGSCATWCARWSS